MPSRRYKTSVDHGKFHRAHRWVVVVGKPARGFGQLLSDMTGWCHEHSGTYKEDWICVGDPLAANVRFFFRNESDAESFASAWSRYDVHLVPNLDFRGVDYRPADATAAELPYRPHRPAPDWLRAERFFPYRVDMPIPTYGFGDDRLQGMHQWCCLNAGKFRAAWDQHSYQAKIAPRQGAAAHRAGGQWVVRFYFLDPTVAKALAELWREQGAWLNAKNVGQPAGTQNTAPGTGDAAVDPPMPRPTRH